MADRVLRGSRLGAVSYETDRNHDLAPRTIREQLLSRDPKSPLWRRLVAWSDFGSGSPRVVRAASLIGRCARAGDFSPPCLARPD